MRRQEIKDSIALLTLRGAAQSLPEDMSDWALFLDFDGTLVDIAPTPDAVVLESPIKAALGSVAARCDQALALVSGRPIAELDTFLAPLELAAAGVHGQELRLADGCREDSNLSTDLSRLRSIMLEIERNNAGVLVEDKGHALALHTRARPDLAERCHQSLLALVAENDDLCLLEGHCVLEVKAKGIHKGTAVRRLMTTPPFLGLRPLFVGDDCTDEDGIKAVQELGGLGVRIGPPPSVAAIRLERAEDFRDWLVRQAS